MTFEIVEKETEDRALKADCDTLQFEALIHFLFDLRDNSRSNYKYRADYLRGEFYALEECWNEDCTNTVPQHAIANICNECADIDRYREEFERAVQSYREGNVEL